ncbi:serine/threonine-protein kinase [Nocardioides sp. AE5]|uniref:serine/threonine-protein kinase n=1 Tax=Nocardioides sp. AE5 TaxID=2962573 RepID=UPI002881A28D|nr:serine/threonine-protein kinase [Nocardioides sp. AE5]MDT0203074.1 serine/threonine-protein kinase [Nocardioides sp. AE5]
MRFPQPGERFGRYQVQDRIGMGGMGVVFRAVDTHLNRVVALKVVSGQHAGLEEFLHRFEREADVMARLDSPHVVAIHDHGVEDGLPWISTQYVGGGDLGHLLKRGPLHLHHAAIVCAQLAHALDDAHRAGVVHRDVKPSNVLVREGNEPWVYLCDFGIAHTGAAGLTATGGVAGSWAWLAPERTSGHPGTPASDIYSLGCVLHATLTGRAPFVGSDVEVALAQVNSPVPQFPGTDPTTEQVNEILRRSMAKDPADRYRSAAEFRTALLALTGSQPVHFPVGPHQPRPEGASTTEGGTTIRGARQQRRSRRMVVGAAALGLVVLGGAAAGGWWLLRPDDPQDPTAGAQRVAGDVDGDGYGDLFFRWFGHGDESLPSVDYLVRSTGNGFAAPEKRERPDGLSAAGDVDGDGLVDVIGYDHRSTTDLLTVQIRFGDTRTATVEYPEAGRREEAYPILGDVDGDGHDDMILVWTEADPPEGKSRTTAVIEVARGHEDGFGELEPAGQIEDWAGSLLDEVMAGDLDGDGRADLVLKRPAANQELGGRTSRLTAIRSTDNGFEVAGSRDVIEDQDYSAQYVLADVDGNGSDEVVAHVSPADGPAQVQVFAFVDSKFADPVVWFTDDEGATTRGLTATDMDGDGLEDVVLLRDPPGDGTLPLTVARSDGSAFSRVTESGITCVVEECKESWHVLRAGA